MNNLWFFHPFSIPGSRAHERNKILCTWSLLHETVLSNPASVEQLQGKMGFIPGFWRKWQENKQYKNKIKHPNYFQVLYRVLL